MTASTVKSTRVANCFDASPKITEPAGVFGGLLKHSSDTAEAATTSIDEVADTILMLPIASNQRLSSLKIFNDDLDTHSTPTLAVDVGLYNGPEKFVTSAGTTYAAGAVLDADVFASAITTLQAANTAGVEIRYESGVTYGEIAKIGKRLWEALNLPEDPKRFFVIGITLTGAAATAAAGTISLEATHSD